MRKVIQKGAVKNKKGSQIHDVTARKKPKQERKNKNILPNILMKIFSDPIDIKFWILDSPESPWSPEDFLAM